jgi:hypothetical protein
MFSLLSRQAALINAVARAACIWQTHDRTNNMVEAALSDGSSLADLRRAIG